MKDQGKRVERLETASGEGDEPVQVELVRGPSMTRSEAETLKISPLLRSEKVTRIELVGVLADADVTRASFDTSAVE